MVVFVLLLATVVLAPLAERAKLPHPVLVTVFAFALSFAPGVPQLNIPTDLLLPLLLPPLIYAAAQRTSWRQFLANATPILLLAVALVFVTTAAVAAVAWEMVPGMTPLAAVALGAIVSPPDPVAAEAVAGPLGLPRHVMSILSGEGLFNDVATLTIYQVAVLGVVSGSFSVGHAVGAFALAIVGGVLAGLVLGRLTLMLSARLDSPTLINGLTLLMPFAAYELADRLHCSGVLAVLVFALYLGHFGMDADAVAGRLEGAAFWEVVELLVTGFGFGLVGIDLRHAVTAVVSHNGLPAGQLIAESAAICGVVIVVRALWLFPMALVAARRARRLDEDAPTDWRETSVMVWAGMRGVVTVATAFALPETLNSGAPYPAREAAIVIALAVVLVTLVLQGLTLPWVVTLLRVRAPADVREAAERVLIARAGKAALVRLKELQTERDLPEGLCDVVTSRFRAMTARAEHGEHADEAETEVSVLRPVDIERLDRRRMRRELESELFGAARRAVVNARTEPGADPEVVDAVLRYLDVRSLSMM